MNEKITKDKIRCFWVNPKNQIYVDYHDNEWARPVFDEKILFEFIILESAQAGLSFEIIINKREGYKNAFDDFNAEKIANYDEEKIVKLLSDPSIVRNRLKIEAAINNAKAFLKIQKEFGSFSKYLWGFVKETPLINEPKSKEELAVSTALSETLYKDLKKRGFKFFGKKTTYAYMQAMGLINDHMASCFLKADINLKN
jgi:DNA-3-methyladenine glycosylase I